MKKLIYFLFSFLLLFSLASCDNNNNDNNQNNQNQEKPDDNKGGKQEQKEDDTPKLPENYYANLFDLSSAYKMEINKLLLPLNTAGSLNVEDSYVEFYITSDYDLEIYGDVKYNVTKSEEILVNEEAKFYILNNDVYYVVDDKLTNNKSYEHVDVLEIEAVKPLLDEFNQELVGYANMSLSDALKNKELKQEFFTNAEDILIKVLSFISKYTITDSSITAEINFEGLEAFNDSLRTDTLATTIDKVFGSFTFMTIKNLVLGTRFSKSLFDYKLSDIAVLDQMSSVSLDEIEKDANTYIAIINNMLGEKKLPFNNVNELLRLVALKLEITVDDDVKLKEFLALKEVSGYTINEVINTLAGKELKLKEIAANLFDLCYKYPFYPLATYLLTATPETDLTKAPECDLNAVSYDMLSPMVDAIIAMIEKIDYKLTTDQNGNLSKITFKLIPDDLIIDFDLTITKITYQDKDTFKAEVIANA